MLQPFLPALFMALSIQTAGIISPGPSVALILTNATIGGRRSALLCALGIAFGSGVLASATVLGLTALFAQMAEVMVVVRLIGAAYLGYLAWGAFRRAWTPPPLDLRQAPSGRGAMAAGFLLQTTNPKAIFFWLAIAAAGGIGAAPPVVMALFVGLATLNSFLGHALYALILSGSSVRAFYARARRWIEAGLGTFFAAFALRLLLARD